MRVPGEGTDKLIDRKQEAAVYEASSGKGLCDDPVYIDPDTGYKITRYLEGVRVCDADSVKDLRRCMKKLRDFHEMALSVGHEFDIFGQIDFYESLWDGRPSVYRDYPAVKERVLSLQPFIEAHAHVKTLTHIDAVPDNFLFFKGEGGEEQLQLTDWEYAGMQDPHVDIAMFCIYSMYDKEQVDRLIGIYFGEEEGAHAVPAAVVAKIYAYIAACGLLWSNWCEYKLSLGVEFGIRDRIDPAKRLDTRALKGDINAQGIKGNHHGGGPGRAHASPDGADSEAADPSRRKANDRHSNRGAACKRNP